MAPTNCERVGKARELLREGLTPFLERELENRYRKYRVTTVTGGWHNEPTWIDEQTPHLDVAILFRMMWAQWNEYLSSRAGDGSPFGTILDRMVQSRLARQMKGFRQSLCEDHSPSKECIHGQT